VCSIEAKDYIACERSCAADNARDCEIVGELAAKPENETTPGYYSLGPALRFFTKGCALGVKTACDKGEALLNELRTACQKTAKTCTVLGRTLEAQIKGHDGEIDQSFERACKAGDADGCEARGELHAGWEPLKAHGRIAERAYDRACTLGLAGACCALAGIYRDADQEKKSDQAMARFNAAEDKANAGRVSCGDRFGGQSMPRVHVVAKTDVSDPVSGQSTTTGSLSKTDVAALEEVLSRRIAQCYQAVPPAPAHLELELQPDDAARSISYSSAEQQPCVARVVEDIHLAVASPLRMGFALSFVAMSKAGPAKP
jgi:hypothetical protein